MSRRELWIWAENHEYLSAPSMSHSLLLATVYAGGSHALSCIVAALAIFVLTGLISLLGLALSPFPRTACVAHKLGFVGMWGGFVALALALASSGFVAFEHVDLKLGTPEYRLAVTESLLVASVIALAPLTGVGALCWSRRTAEVNSVALELGSRRKMELS